MKNWKFRNFGNIFPIFGALNMIKSIWRVLKWDGGGALSPFKGPMIGPYQNIATCRRGCLEAPSYLTFLNHYMLIKIYIIWNLGLLNYFGESFPIFNKDWDVDQSYVFSPKLKILTKIENWLLVFKKMTYLIKI